MLRVEVFGPVVVRDEVRFARGAEGVGLFVPVAGWGGAVGEITARVEVEFCVDVELLEAGDGVGVGGGFVNGSGGVGGVCGGGEVLAESVEEVPILVSYFARSVIMGNGRCTRIHPEQQHQPSPYPGPESGMYAWYSSAQSHSHPASIAFPAARHHPFGPTAGIAP